MRITARWDILYGVQPQRARRSPLIGARQTAEILHEGLKLEGRIEFVDSLAG